MHTAANRIFLQQGTAMLLPCMTLRRLPTSSSQQSHTSTAADVYTTVRCLLPHLALPCRQVNLSTQQRLALWNPHAGAATGAKGSPMDLRAILDKEGKTACMVAATRRFHTLVGLLDAAVPLPLPEDALPARPPAMLCCPITLDLMNDPVVLADGHTYERAAIEKWLLARATSPLTNLPLPQRAVYPNLAVRQVINEWRVQHGLPELPRPAPAHGSGAAAPPGLPGAALGAASGGGALNAAASPFSRNRALSQVDEFIQDLGPRRRGFMATAIPA